MTLRRHILEKVNPLLRHNGAPEINKSGIDFLEKIIARKKHGVQMGVGNAMYAGIYLNRFDLEPIKTPEVWSAKSSIDIAIDVHVANGVVCFYLNQTSLPVWYFTV